jgi:hypothetical protein
MTEEHTFQIEIPHSAERIFSAMQDYDLWKEFSQSFILDVEVLFPGDAQGNGLLRRIQYKLPWGSKYALELVTDLKPNVGYTYRMLGRDPELDTTGSITLEPIDSDRTIVHFKERFNLKKLPLIYRLMGKRIYKFINKRNEEVFQNLANWLDDHPDFPKEE